MLRLASCGAHGAGCTRPLGVTKNLSFSPNAMYTRQERPTGTLSLAVPPLPGPLIATSGAGVGGMEPAGQLWKVPPASTYPSRPVFRFTPSTYRNTVSPRPELFLTFNGNWPCGAAFAGATAISVGTATASATMMWRSLRFVYTGTPWGRIGTARATPRAPGRSPTNGRSGHRTR